MLPTGSIEVDGRRFTEGHMLVFVAGQAGRCSPRPSPPWSCCSAASRSASASSSGISCPRRKERIEQAKSDWRAGRMKLPQLDDGEFIPLPPQPGSTAAQPL